MPTTGQRTEPLGLLPAKPRPRLYDHVIGVLRVRHYSPRTKPKQPKNNERFNGAKTTSAQIVHEGHVFHHAQRPCCWRVIERHQGISHER